MKYLFILVFICATSAGKAQKYILLDESISQPAVYTDHLSELNKYKKFFPIEVKDLPQFVSVLQQIVQRLKEKKLTNEVRNYTVGCSQFTGKAFPLTSGERIDYVLTSTCDGKKVTMHLCDAKLSNANNAYFVETWIKYIQSNVKTAVGSR
jgi:hypothetical protein